MTGMLAYWLGQAAALIVLAVLFVAVLWEANHLMEWAGSLWAAHGDGSVSSYLRYHAYTYVTWFFGTDFGWTIQ